MELGLDSGLEPVDDLGVLSSPSCEAGARWMVSKNVNSFTLFLTQKKLPYQPGKLISWIREIKKSEKVQTNTEVVVNPNNPEPWLNQC